MIQILLKLFIKDYQNVEDQNVRKKYGLFASFYGLITNFLLFCVKIVLGILLGLFSIVTDSVNNLSDFGNNFIAIIGVKASSKKPDKEHPYGHQRVEYILSLIIACIIIGLSMVMMYQGILDVVSFFSSIAKTGYPPKDEINYVMYVVSLSVLSFAILAKLSQAAVYFSLGKKISSMPLKALGKDSRNDVITTLFVILGILITWFSGYSVDCFFTLFVAFFVALSGVGIMKEAISALIGEEPSKELIEKLIHLIRSHEGVLGLHDLAIHSYGRLIFGVIHVEVDDRVDISKSHQLVDHIERECLKNLNVHLTIHMDPIKVNDKKTDDMIAFLRECLRKYSSQKILMHDFHSFSENGKPVLEFELVVPDSLDDEKSHESILSYLKKEIDEKYHQDYVLDIGFDNRVQDFLYETDIEEK